MRAGLAQEDDLDLILEAVIEEGNIVAPEGTINEPIRSHQVVVLDPDLVVDGIEVVEVEATILIANIGRLCIRFFILLK